MTKDEIIVFINKHMSCTLGTVDAGKPRVRGIGIYRADGNGIIFHTGKLKDLYKQLSENPFVEMCFMDMQTYIQIRISGKAELVEDQNLKKEIVEHRPFLKPMIEKHGYEAMPVYCVKDGQATVWDMTANYTYPKPVVQL
jgi:uncharacterized pyridoxamine 5'-phosphate oxidase family protein